MMGIKICIDAGHYGKYNRSPAIPEYYESDMVWKLHLLQKQYLEEYEGVTVITTRQNQATDKALYDRGACSKGCDLFISDHSNAVGSGVNDSVDYVAVYHLTDDTTTQVDDISKVIAGKLAPVIADVMGASQGGRIVTRKSENDRNGDGMLNDNYYGVLHGARMVNTPGMILEHSFHTNTKMTLWLLDDSNLARLARAEVEVLAAHFGLKKKGDAASADTTGTQAAALKDLSEKDMIAKVGTLFTADQQRSGILASVSFAQFILESGWGKSELAQNANNCFGMKCSLSGNTWGNSAWDGSSKYTKETKEQGTDGSYETITADFRKYPDIEHSIADHSAYLIGAMKGSKKRYEGLAGEKDYKKAVQLIKDGGYATALTYVDNLCSIIETWNLTQYDVQNTPAAPTAGVKYKVQAGAYSKQDNAAKQEKELKAAGFDTYMVKVGNLYKIQVGAYSKKENADAMLAKVKAAGFDAFITTENGEAVATGTPAKKEITVGCNVRVNQGAKTYDGKTLKSFVYARNHQVKSISGDRVVITYQGTVVAAVKKSDLALV